MGEDYTPTVLSVEEYNAIVNGDTDGTGDDDEDSSGTFVPGTGVCDGTGPNA
jgi:hypothetical protein